MNFINGEFVASVSGKTIAKMDPTTGEVSRQVPDSSLMDVVKAVQAGNAAFTTWSKSSIETRVTILKKFASLISKNADSFALAAARDLGTPVSQTLKFSVVAAVEHFEAHARLLEMQSETKPGPTHHPVGLVAVITPASDPLTCLASRLAPALAGSNAIIVKPSSLTPETAELIAKLSIEAGLPAGVLGLLQGRGVEIGESLVQHPGVSTLAFMGSTDVGRRIQSLAADGLKRVHLSLGAKNPVLVFAGVDLEPTMNKVAAICAGLFPARSMQGSRVFIHQSIFKPALEVLKFQLDAVKVGSPFESETSLGPLPSIKALLKFNDAAALAQKENGRHVALSSSGLITQSRGYFVRPVLFADLTNCSTLQQDEVVGPLVLASSFKYQHEALKQANNSPFGRAAFIFEPDLEKAAKIAGKTEVGSIYLNSFTPNVMSRDEIPLLKNSGNSSEGLLDLAKFFLRRSFLLS